MRIESTRQVDDKMIGEVRVKGLEPSRLSSPDPKSGAAANYATPACVEENRAQR